MCEIKEFGNHWEYHAWDYEHMRRIRRAPDMNGRWRWWTICDDGWVPAYDVPWIH